MKDLLVGLIKTWLYTSQRVNIRDDNLTMRLVLRLFGSLLTMSGLPSSSPIFNFNYFVSESSEIPSCCRCRWNLSTEPVLVESCLLYQRLCVANHTNFLLKILFLSHNHNDHFHLFQFTLYSLNLLNCTKNNKRVSMQR